MTSPATSHRHDMRRRTITLVAVLLILCGAFWLAQSATAHAAPPTPQTTTPTPRPKPTAVATPSGPVQISIVSVKVGLGVYYITLADGRGGAYSPRSSILPAPTLTTGPATLNVTTIVQGDQAFAGRLTCPKGKRCP